MYFIKFHDSATCKQFPIFFIFQRMSKKVGVVAPYSKSLNPTPHISKCSSVGSALDLESKGCWFEPTVCHYFSSNNDRLLAYTS